MVAPTITLATHDPAPSGELVVNATTSGTQQTPTVTALPGGGYVVTWQGNGPGDSSGIFVQRYDASGTPVGAEVRANTTTAGGQGSPSVAALSDGSYVVTWQSLEDVNFTTSVFMQRYDATGAPLGGEVQVNTSATPTHIKPSVAALSGGGYVITWNGNGTGDASGIFMQRYDASGTALGGETLVNTTTASDQTDSAVTALSDGGYVVTWQGNGTGDGAGIFIQRYDASGTAVGGEVLVNTTTTGNQILAAVAALADGGFVVTWYGNGTGDADGVFAQRYDASGAPVGGEVLVNTTTSLAQSMPSVAGLADGGYVITWQLVAGAGNIEVYSQQYDASGAPVGGETQVATLTTNDQYNPVIAASSDGTYFIAWQTEAQEGSTTNIAAQLFDPNFAAVEGTALELKGTIALDDVDDSGGSYTLTLSVAYGTLSVTPGSSGVSVDDSNPRSVIITGTLAELQALLGSDPTSSVTYTTEDDAPPATMDLDITLLDDGAESTTSTAVLLITGVNDAPDLDLDFFEAGNDAALDWSEGDGPVAIAPLAVFGDDNSSFDGATVTAAFTVNGAIDDELTILSVGDGPGEIRVDGTDVYYEGTLVGSFTGGTNGNALVVTFNEDACHCSVQMVIASIAFDNDSANPATPDRTVTITLVDGGGTDNGGADTASADVVISVTPVNSAPTVTLTAYEPAASGEVQVNSFTAGNQLSPTLASLANGGHVVVWASEDQDGDGFGIYLQRFDSSGAPDGAETRVNATTAGDQSGPSVAVLANGVTVVTWHSSDGSAGGIYSQSYDASGAPVGGEFLVNFTSSGDQSGSDVVALTGGGYVVVWQSQNQDGSGWGIYAQRFEASGAPAGAETHVSTTTAGDQDTPAVAALADGGYVVAWESPDGSSTGIYVQRYDATGAPVGVETLVNTTTAGTQDRPSVTGLADGGYLVAWTGDGIIGQRFDASGASVGGEIQISTAPGGQVDPAVTALLDGGYVVTWLSTATGDVYSRRFDADDVGDSAQQLVNTYTTNGQGNPAIALVADGGYVIAWQSVGQDGSSTGVYSQRFDANFAATEGVALDLKDHVTLADTDDNGGTVTVTLEVDYGEIFVDTGTSGVSIDFADPDYVVLSGTLAQLQALFGSDPTSEVTYTTSDGTPPDTAELSVTIDDGEDSSTSTTTISIAAVDSPPELDLDYFEAGNDAAATYVEGDDPAYLAFFATFDDDNGEWDGATLTVAIDSATADDQLSIDSVGTGTGELSVSGSNILYEGVIVGSFTGGANGDPLVITFNADACACAIELTAASILYESTGTNLTPSTRDVDFTFVDGSDTVTATSELSVVPAPSPPDIVTGGDGAAHQGVAGALTGIVITDAGDPVTGLITVQLSVANGTLSIRTDVSGGITAAQIVNGSGTGAGITIVATPDQINATLAASNGLTYTSDADFYGTDALTIRASDGVPASPVSLDFLSTQPFGLIPSALAFADIDGDTLDDIVIGLADPLGTDPGFILTLAGGPPAAFPLDAGAPEDFVFADFDGDGEVDIAFAAYLDDGSSYVAYLSSDTGDIETIANVPYALDLASGDFDGNGLLDLAVADSDNGRVGVILQTAPGVFAAPVYDDTTAALTVAVATGDFDGDGVIDLLKVNLGVLPGFGTPGTVDLLVGNGDGTFQDPVNVLTEVSNLGGVTVADFNNDGILDFAVATIDNGEPGAFNGVEVMLGDGTGGFNWVADYTTSADGEPSRVVAADINGDGIPDLIVANFDDPGTVSILVGNGDGSFQSAIDLDTGDNPYVIAVGDPDQDGDIDLLIGNFGDGTGDAFNNDTFHTGSTGTKSIIVNAASIAVPDTGSSVVENATVAIDVVANDTDLEGDTRSVAKINGTDVTVGVAFTLASGALATLNADGTITYDPNGKFNSLISAATATRTGASNTSTTDTFTYTLLNGTFTTVTVTITGAESAGDLYYGSTGNDLLGGYPGNDFFNASQGGDDRVAGGEGDDTVYFGAAFTTADVVKGGVGQDTLILQGDYSAGFTLSNVISVETLILMTAANLLYGASGAGSNDYSFTVTDAIVVAGSQLTVQGNKLGATENLNFDGSAETDGMFRVIGGAADDILKGGGKDDQITGGAGLDMLTGGGGNDTFIYRAVTESRGSAIDEILDFTAGDKLDLQGIDANTASGGNDAFSFIGTAAFSNTAGELRVEFSGGVWRVLGDVDGDGTADFEVHLTTTGGHVPGAGDFFL